MNNKDDGDEPPSTTPECPLFPGYKIPLRKKQRLYGRIDQPIWTDHKAKFIQQYLKTFIQITKHGAYIDGFAGPQYFAHLDKWAAALVLKIEPKWLRHFFLCEKTKKGAKALQKIAEAEPRRIKDRQGRTFLRNVEVWSGDFNENIGKILSSGKISQAEATFCLLDQRTFECHWKTLERLAAYKKAPRPKIELLYFLGVGWIHRAFSGIKNREKLRKWWGSDGFERLKTMREHDIAQLVCQRFLDELGYKHVAPYPIFDREKSNRVMYYMVHASDHDEAPALMVRAHRKTVRSQPKGKQRGLFKQER